MTEKAINYSLNFLRTEDDGRKNQGENRQIQMPNFIQNRGIDEPHEGRFKQVDFKGGTKMKEFTVNKREMLTALQMALAFILPIWGGMYLVAKVWG